MAIEKVREFMKQKGYEEKIQEFDESSATVELAAHALNTEPCRIAKTMSFKIDEKAILIVTAGDTKIDNHKYKEKFGTKAKLLTPDEVIKYIGHAIGGVCPFAIPSDVNVYIDESVKRFSTVFPACGSSNSAIELTIDELYTLSDAIEWVDVCKIKE